MNEQTHLHEYFVAHVAFVDALRAQAYPFEGWQVHSVGVLLESESVPDPSAMRDQKGAAAAAAWAEKQAQKPAKPEDKPTSHPGLTRVSQMGHQFGSAIR